MAKPKQYSIYQSPPKKWYKRQWKAATQLMGALVVVSAFGLFGVIQLLDSQAGPKVVNASEQMPRPQEPAKPLNTSGENIIDIQSVLDEWQKSQGQKWSVSVKSIDGPVFDAHLNQDTQHEVRSLYPLFMASPLSQEFNLDRQNNTQLLVNGTKRSMTSCMALALRLNDENCTKALSGYVSPLNATSQLKARGLTRTIVTSDLTIKTTADDATRFIAQLRADLLPGEIRDSVLKSLREHIGKQAIAAGCPGCTVANKTQDNEPTVHDSALVQYKRGTYVISVFSENGSYAQIAVLSSKIQQKITEATTQL